MNNRRDCIVLQWVLIVVTALLVVMTVKYCNAVNRPTYCAPPVTAQRITPWSVYPNPVPRRRVWRA